MSERDELDEAVSRVKRAFDEVTEEAHELSAEVSEEFRDALEDLEHRLDQFRDGDH